MNYYIKNDEEMNEELEILAEDIIEDFESGCYDTMEECINDKVEYCFDFYESFSKYNKDAVIGLMNWIIEEE